ncbi:MAG: FKBP-type peptidyl-prolyl cis-trans isomerase [Gammaproteobacteria bacterium]|nr:FKBP-type peptidyl-prolyl cis-trans isomerase [Gammaproteobacteria bacterium]
MSNQIAKGIKLLSDIPGEGHMAAKGDVVTYNARFFLRKGDEVTHDAQSIDLYRPHLNIRTIGGIELIDHTTTLGKRQPIAGVEKSLYGMQPGGFREVLVNPHLGYGETGLAGLIPANAILRIQLWVQGVQVAA